MAEIPCPVCTRATPDGLLCKVDTARLRHKITELPELLRELRTTRTRQTRFGRPSGGGSRGSDFVGPVPWDERASVAAGRLTETTVQWLPEFAAHTEVVRTPVCVCIPPAAPCRVEEWIRVVPTPGTTLPEWSAWLLARMPRVRSHPHVDRFVEELDYAIREAHRAIDRPVDLEYVCACPVCGSEVYAPKGADIATCRECARVLRAATELDVDDQADIPEAPTFDIAAEHVRRLEAVQQALIPARDLGTAIGLSRTPVNRKTVTSWINRGRLTSRACDLETRAELFHVGDALRLAAQIPDPPAPIVIEPPEVPRRRRRTRAGKATA